MMRYYILDDNFSVVKVLENIINTQELGIVVGSNTEPDKA